MLQAMRENTKIILWITVIAFVLLIFLVWGLDLSVGGGAPNNAVGMINGEPLTVAAYQRAYQQSRQAATAQGRDLQPSELLALEEQTWEYLIEEILLAQEADRMGLTASDAEVRSVLLNNPPRIPAFVNEDGTFNLELYRQYILNPNVPEGELLALENLVRVTLPLDKLRTIIVSGAKVTEDELRRAYVEGTERATISYVLVPAAAVEGTPTPEELQAHYEVTRDQYQLERRGDLRYISLPRVPPAADSAALRLELREFAEEARQALTTGEALRYNDFATLAMTFSDGPNADDGGLTAGYLASEEMTPAFRSAVDGLAVGDISQPFQDGGFYHIVQVVADTADAGERRVQLRDLARRIVPSDSTLLAVRDQLDAIRTQAQAVGLEAAATEHGFIVERVNDVTESGFVPGLSGAPGVGSFAVNGRLGDVSRIYETNNAWFLVEVADVKEPGQADFTSAQASVSQDLQRERRLAASRAAADQLMGQLKLGTSLTDAATAAGLDISANASGTRLSGFPGLGVAPEVMAGVFSTPAGQFSGPYRTDRGWVVLRVDERTPVNEEQFAQQAQALRNNLLQQKQISLYNAYVESLRRQAKVEDFRL